MEIDRHAAAPRRQPHAPNGSHCPDSSLASLLSLHASPFVRSSTAILFIYYREAPMTALRHDHIVRPFIAKNPKHEPLALSAIDAARRIGISPRLLWTLTKENRIPHARIGRRVVYPVAALEDWLAQQTHATRTA